MDPAEEIREAKRQKDDFNMLRYVCDSQYGIPRRCFCGSSIIDEVRANDTIDTLPGRRFFTCKNYEADGFHYRQPWVVGVQEELEKLTKRMADTEEVVKGLSIFKRRIDNLEVNVDNLTEEVDNLNGQVDTLQKVCFD
ncbi:hypothetical protein Bca101_020469 [Brassica carinata]